MDALRADLAQRLLLFVVEVEIIDLREKRLDPGEERGVGADRLIMGRELRRNIALDRADLLGRIRAGEVPEDRRDLVEGLARELQRIDRVREARRVRIAGDRLHFGAMPLHRGCEGGREIGRADGPEVGGAEGSVGEGFGEACHACGDSTARMLCRAVLDKAPAAPWEKRAGGA